MKGILRFAAETLTMFLGIPSVRSRRSPQRKWIPARLPDNLIRATARTLPTQQTGYKITSVLRTYTISEILVQIQDAGPNAYKYKPVTLDYYLPRSNGKVPAVLILPILGGSYSDYLLERYFAHSFARGGLAALIIRQERHELITNEAHIDAILQESVQESIAVLDWIETHPELDSGRVSIFGISMGAVRGALLAAVDRRVKAAVLALTGGDIPYIMRHSQDGAWRGGGIAGKRAAYLKQEQMTPAAFETRLRNTVVWDPLKLAPYIDNPKKILLFLAAFDRVIPFRKGLELRRALGKPETIILPSGHYSAALFLPYARHLALKFIRRKIGITSPTANY